MTNVLGFLGFAPQQNIIIRETMTLLGLLTKTERDLLIHPPLSIYYGTTLPLFSLDGNGAHGLGLTVSASLVSPQF